MTKYRSTHIRNTAQRAIAIAAGALAVAAITASPASAAVPTRVVPATGVVRCDNVGALTTTGGHFRQRETTTIDRRGRAHVLFTIATDRVRLVGADGTRYRLIGIGFDDVLYPGTALTGDVVHENEQFYFTVVTGHHVVGVIRLHLHTKADQIPHVHDSSTCRLPHMS